MIIHCNILELGDIIRNRHRIYPYGFLLVVDCVPIYRLGSVDYLLDTFMLNKVPNSDSLFCVGEQTKRWASSTLDTNFRGIEFIDTTNARGREFVELYYRKIKREIPNEVIVIAGQNIETVMVTKREIQIREFIKL